MEVQTDDLKTRVHMEGDSTIRVEGVIRVLLRPVTPPPEGEAWNDEYSRELVIETSQGVIEVALLSEEEDALNVNEEGKLS